MRERGLSLTVLVVMVVVVVMGAAKDTTATPPPTTPHHHNHHTPSGGPTTMQANHVEDEYLDDALDDWLNNFDTYTFMVKQDLDAHDDEEGEEDYEAATEEPDVVEEEEQREEWSAPIAVSVGSKSLLDPHLDYLVTVESLVAEEGSIFLTLSKYNNQTKCGVGGLTVEAAMRSPPRRTAGGGGGGRSSTSGGLHNSSSTVTAYDLQIEDNITLPDTSAWAEVSEDYWWGRGRLAGGGMLSITFTPPECGCLALSTYYALPVGNMTLVVGPQAYPDELQILLCIDPLALAPDHEDYDEEEEAEHEEEEYIQKPSALVAPRDEAEGDPETEAQEIPEEQQPPVTPRRRKQSRGGRRKVKKTRRQMKRQRIRQAGRRQARRQQRQQQRQEEEKEGEEGEGIKGARRRWKQKRKGKKAWRRIKKQGRKGRRRFHGGRHHVESVNGTSPDNETDHHHHHHHHHPHHHHLHSTNATAAFQQEERLIDILLRDLPAENSTVEEDDEEVALEETTAGEEGEVEAGPEEGEADLTPRQRRKNRRRQKKMMRKQRKKVHPPGVKFCCKQGVKHKKNLLEINSTSDDSPEQCSSNSNVVSTFANHQFGIEVDDCEGAYTQCCTKFTADMWDSIKAKKMARKIERKQRRKSRRQDRKHRRQSERRMRKDMKKQSRHQDEAEEDHEGGDEFNGTPP